VGWPFEFEFPVGPSFARRSQRVGAVALGLIPLAFLLALSIPVRSIGTQDNKKKKNEKTHHSQTATKDGEPAKSTSKTNTTARQLQTTAALTTAVVSSPL
jgi:hypothetical protein